MESETEPEPEPASSRRSTRAREREARGPSRRVHGRAWPDMDPRRALPYGGVEAEAAPAGFKFPFDPLRLIEALKRNWFVLFACGCVLGTIGFAGGAALIPYTVSVNLLRRDSPNVPRSAEASEQFRPRDYSDQTLFAFMKSGEILKRVADKAAANPVIAALKPTPLGLAKTVSIKPSPNPDWVTVSVEGFGHLGAMVELVNLYAREAADYTKDIQQRDSKELNDFLQRKLAEADLRIQQATAELRGFAHTPAADFAQETDSDLKRLFDYQARLESRQIALETLNAEVGARETELKKQAPTNTRLAAAKQGLEEMLSVQGKTESHPDVIRQRIIIKNLEQSEKSEEKPAVSIDGNPALMNNAAYLRLVDLRSQKPGIENEIKEIQTHIQQLTDKLGKSSDVGIKYLISKSKLDSLNNARQALDKQQRDAGNYAENALGYFKAPYTASIRSVNFAKRWLKILGIAAFAGTVGFLLSMLTVLVREALDTTIKTPEDVTRVTGLPVLATLGDLKKMSPGAQVNWAFRTLTTLRGKLNVTGNRALVCGIISSTHGEGRSTWVNLLVSAASQRGLRVLTVDTRPASTGPATKPEPTPAPAEAKQEDGTAKGSSEPLEPVQEPPQPNMTLTSNVLTAPARVTEQLTDPNSQPVVHIPLPGWVWNLERRKQWKQALEHWRKIENLVIFVELPPATQAEAVLLSENIPQMLWLSGSGMADSTETAAQLETLRHARCRLVGAVLNFAPPPVFNTRISRWFGKFAPALLLVASVAVQGAQNSSERGAQRGVHKSSVTALRKQLQQTNEEPERAESPARVAPEQILTDAQEQRTEPIGAPDSSEVTAKPVVQGDAGNPPVTATAVAFSGTAQKRKAAWQEHLTLGPGDTVDIHFFGNPALSRTNVFVGPDGRLSYLQMQGLTASGLTVEELRAQLDNGLSKYYAGARTIVVPIAFTSKKYYMLGKVAGRGVYVMDRPLTLIEAVARAKGLETGLYQRNSVEMADLSHSFIVRNGERLPVDFEKLFLDGDLSQNVVIEPDDYVYFASAAANEIYVLGEVMNPGPIGFVSDTSLITVLTDRGGFNERAYKKKVLVVRGSLSQPETFAVDANGILEGRDKDFKLQPRDIVFVSKRPWIKAEQVLDDAAAAFIEGAATTWVGANMHPIIKHRLLPYISR